MVLDHLYSSPMKNSEAARRRVASLKLFFLVKFLFCGARIALIQKLHLLQQSCVRRHYGLRVHRNDFARGISHAHIGDCSPHSRGIRRDCWCTSSLVTVHWMVFILDLLFLPGARRFVVHARREEETLRGVQGRHWQRTLQLVHGTGQECCLSIPARRLCSQCQPLKRK